MAKPKKYLSGKPAIDAAKRDATSPSGSPTKNPNGTDREIQQQPQMRHVGRLAHNG